MPQAFLDLTTVIDSLTRDKLLPLARFFGGASNLRKDAALALLHSALSDPEAPRRALADASGLARTALAIMKRYRARMGASELGHALLAAGVETPLPAADMVGGLEAQGALLRTRTHYGGYDSYDSSLVEPDFRVLAAAPLPAPRPITLAPQPVPERLAVRRPQTVFLELQGFISALEGLGGLPVTKQRRFKVAEFRKLAKRLRWAEDETAFGAFVLDDPVFAVLVALEKGGLLQEVAGVVQTVEPAAELGACGVAAPVLAALRGFIAAREWDDVPEGYGGFRVNHYYLHTFRCALCVALSAISDGTAAFYSFDDFSEALYARLGAAAPSSPFHAVRYLKHSPERRAELQAEQRENWERYERTWVESALGTWLHFLGIVELGLEGDRIVSLRVTPLGHEVLRGELAAGALEAAGEPPWVVQPNFDVVVWLDRVSPEQLAFLDANAQRTEVRDHTAHYVLTRESVYAGLQAGTPPEELLGTLAAHSQAELPQNVAAELREWCQARERLHLHRAAELLEYATTAQRDAALAGGLTGRPLADTLVLLPAGATAPKKSQLVDYAAPPTCRLVVDPSAHVQMLSGIAGLQLPALLDCWGERVTPTGWQLTRESVATAGKLGRPVGGLVEALAKRQEGGLSRFLELVLRNWVQKSTAVRFDELLVVQAEKDAVLEALLTDPELRACAAGGLQPNTLVFWPRDRERVEARLRWAGFEFPEGVNLLRVK